MFTKTKGGPRRQMIMVEPKGTGNSSDLGKRNHGDEEVKIMSDVSDDLSADLTETPIVCPDAITRLRSFDPDGDENLLQDLIEIFIEETPELIDRARNALNARNAIELGRVAHSMKGSSGNFGAQRLSKLAYRLERAGGRADFSEAATLLDAISPSFEEVAKELQMVAER